MAISAVASTATTVGATGTSPTISSPAGVAAGDLLICVIATRSSTDTVTAIANGSPAFTKLNFISGATTASLSIWYRIAQAGDPSTWTITNSGNIEATLMAYRGVDTFTFPEAVGTVNTSSSAGPVINSLITATDVDWMVGMCAYNLATSNNISASSPSMTERADAGNGGGTSAKQAVWLGDLAISPAGSSGSVTLTSGSSNNWTTYAIALKPAAAGGGGAAVSSGLLAMMGAG